MASILTNTGAMTALQTLRGINKNLGMVQDQISTGKKVATAADDAAVYSITTVMKADVAGFRAIGESLALGSSTVAVSRSASESVGELLEEIKTKIVAAQEENVDRSVIQDDISQLRDQVVSVVNAAQFNGLNLLQDLEGDDDVNVLASLDRSSDGSITSRDITIQTQDLQTTAKVIGTGADPGAATTATNTASASSTGVTLLNFLGTVGVTTGDGFEITVTDTAGATHAVAVVARDGENINDVVTRLVERLDTLGLQDQGVTFSAGTTTDTASGTATLVASNTATVDVTFAFNFTSGGTAGGGLEELSNIDVSTATGAESALRNIDNLIEASTDAASVFGQAENRLSIQGYFVSTLVDNLNAGIGSLVDADMEEASARLQSLQVQQQLGIQAFSIANQAPQNILALFR